MGRFHVSRTHYHKPEGHVKHAVLLDAFLLCGKENEQS
jgi:hypothetical protein